MSTSVFKNNLRVHLALSIPEQDLRRWFDPLELSYADKSLMVGFPHSFFGDWFKNNFAAPFEEEVLRFLQIKDLSFCYTTACSDGEERKRVLDGMPGAKPDARSASQTLFAQAEKSAPPLAPPSVIAEDKYNLFDMFLYNSKNEFPVRAALEFARGNAVCPLLLIYARSGCGKTHLLNAVDQELKRIVHKKDIYSADINDLVTLFKNNADSHEDVVQRLALKKILLLDNVQNCPSDRLLQEKLVLLIDIFASGGRLAALTLDAHPSSCHALLDKLRSRLEGGVAIEIKRPDLDVRRRYAEQQAYLLGLKLDKNEMLGLAMRYMDFRPLQGAMHKIAAFNEVNHSGRDYPLDFILKNQDKDDKLPDADEISRRVARYFGLEPQDITGKSRLRSVVVARQITMYLCRELLALPLAEIGRMTGGRDHSSVLYSINKVAAMMASDKDTHILVTDLKKLCANPQPAKSIVPKR